MPTRSPNEARTVAWVTTIHRHCQRVTPSARSTAMSWRRRRTAVARAWPDGADGEHGEERRQEERQPLDLVQLGHPARTHDAAEVLGRRRVADQVDERAADAGGDGVDIRPLPHHHHGGVELVPVEQLVVGVSRDPGPLVVLVVGPRGDERHTGDPQGDVPIGAGQSDAVAHGDAECRPRRRVRA
jgi:hypothetical protein